MEHKHPLNLSDRVQSIESYLDKVSQKLMEYEERIESLENRREEDLKIINRLYELDYKSCG